MHVAGYKIFATGYLNLRSFTIVLSLTQTRCATCLLIPWGGEIAVLFIGKHKPYVSQAPPKSLLRFAIAQ